MLHFKRRDHTSHRAYVPHSKSTRVAQRSPVRPRAMLRNYIKHKYRVESVVILPLALTESRVQNTKLLHNHKIIIVFVAYIH